MGSYTPRELFPPAGAWDSHVHVVDEETFPLHPSHPYRPKKATVEDLQAFHAAHGITHACIVAFSVYHTDNRCLVDALKRLKGRGRGVACIDPERVTDPELNDLHHAGVRGVRINLGTRKDVFDPSLLIATARRIKQMGWVIQVYIAMEQMEELADIIPDLGGVQVVIDHLGAPNGSAGPGRSQRGYTRFLQLLRDGQVWTKLSGTYRFPNLPDLHQYVIEILRTAPDRVVWASDWPHSGGVEKNPDGDRRKIQDYRQVDDAEWVSRCKSWCKTADSGDGVELARKIWIDNPRRLWRYDVRGQ